MNCMLFWKGCNRSVDYIDRSHRGLSHVPDEIQRYWRSLEELNLDSNHIRELSRGFYRLVQLRRLSLSDNQIVALSNDIGSFVNLVELDISRNDLSRIPENIKMCKSLQTADFSCNPLEALPAGLMEVKSLVKLCLNDVSLTMLPPEIGNLTSLETLELRDNNLRSLPPAMASLLFLRILDLGGNLMDALPEFIGCLYTLEELRLDCNSIADIPSEIGKLRKLMQLDLSDNHLVCLPAEIRELTSLTDFHLSSNQLESLPDGIGQLRKMCTLKADMNRLTALPSAIGSCQALQELILTENLLSELPAGIGRLKSLTILNVDRNRINKIPPEIGGCSKLSVLSLRDNQVCNLPSDIGNLRQLTVLDVSGNQLRNLPVSLSSCDLKAIWLSESQAQPLLRFQQDIDDETGEKVLTCFLLPQVSSKKLNDSLINDSFMIMSDNTSTVSVHNPYHSSVKFAVDELVHNSERESTLMRHSTPHPKELRSRYSRPLTFDRDINSNGNRKSADSTGEMSSRAAADATKTGSPAAATIVPDVVVCSQQQQVGGVISPLFEGRQDASPLDTSFAILSPLTDPVSVASSQMNLDISLLDEDINESTTTYDTARENFSEEDTLTADDLSSFSSDQDGTFQTVDGIDFKLNDSGSSSGTDVNCESIQQPQKTVIRITRKPWTALGMSIAGGKGSMPFVGNDDGIFISRVTPEGAADRAGLQIGDKVISVNGEGLANASHRRAVKILRNAGDDILLFVIKAADLNIRQPVGVEPLEQQLDDEDDDMEETSSTSNDDDDCDDDDSNKNELHHNAVTSSENRRDDDSTDDFCSLTDVTVSDNAEKGRTKKKTKVNHVSDTMEESAQDGGTLPVEKSNGNEPAEAAQNGSVRLRRKRTNVADASAENRNDSSDSSATKSAAVLTPTSTAARDCATDPTVVLPVTPKHRRPVSCSLVEEASAAATLSSDGDNVRRRRLVTTASRNSNYVSCQDVAGLKSSDVSACSESNLSFMSNGVVRSSGGEEVNLIDLNSSSSSWSNVQRGINRNSVPSVDLNHAVVTSSKYPVENIVIIKTSGSLGISIVGGVGQTSHPFGIDEPGIFISKIRPNSPASKTRLRVGDRVLSVNGKDVQQSTHQEAVDTLVNSKQRVIIYVRHDPQPSGLQEVIFDVAPGQVLGIRIQGGAGSLCGNKYDLTDEGIFVSEIAKGGAAALDGRLLVGHRLLEVNGRCLLGASHREALMAIKSIDTCAVLTICDGYNHIELRDSASRDMGTTNSNEEPATDLHSPAVAVEPSPRQHVRNKRFSKSLNIDTGSAIRAARNDGVNASSDEEHVYAVKLTKSPTEVKRVELEQELRQKAHQRWTMRMKFFSESETASDTDLSTG